MALLDSELYRIKAELGYNVLTIGSEPYISHMALFDQVIAPYLQAGAQTTSTTAVTAASTPTPVSLTLADASDFSSGDIVIVDVDSRQERATIQSLSGSSITLLLSLTHSGTYPVTVEGGEAMVRDFLARIAAVSDQIGEAVSTAGIKRVDDIEFAVESSSGQLSTLQEHRMYWRDELASALGLTNMWRLRTGGGSRVELY